MNELTRENSSTANQPDWDEWIALNLARGCAADGMLRVLLDNGFSTVSACRMIEEAATAAEAQASSEPTGKLFLPSAMRFDTPKAELYGIDSFLSEEECVHLITLMRDRLRRSTTTDDGISEFRTSRTCELASTGDRIVSLIDERIARYMGIPPEQGEQIEAQWYEVGQEFKPHTDYFEPASSTYDEHVGNRGQRSWTFMIYLNTTREGGTTLFPRLNLEFTPQAGTALIWNNRDANGELNPQTLHHGTPVTKGFKCVVTKWFRSVAPVASYIKEANEYLPPLTRKGFLKLAAPTSMFASLASFYEDNRHAAVDESVPGGFIQADSPKAPSVLIELDKELQQKIHHEIQPIVEAWCGHNVEPTFVYGIREYHRGSILKVHRDRMDTHIASAIINVAQEVDHDWPLYIEDNQYRGSELYLQPGEMVLYEGCRLAHGRPSAFAGERYANVFVHFSLAE